MEIKLGDKVRCKITGLEGIATARCEYLTGCIHIGITPKVGNEGKYPDVIYLDISQIELIKEEKAYKALKDIGGPRTDCPKY